MDVGLWKDSVDMSGVMPSYATYGASPGAYAAGSLLGYGLVYALKSSSLREAVVVNIEVSVGGYSITSVEVVPTGDHTSTQALERALVRGLDTIAEKIAAMRYWDIPRDRK